MNGSSPRAGGPSRRRSFTPAQKLEHLSAYEAAGERSDGGGYLRRNGLYSSLISEWRRLRDAGESLFKTMKYTPDFPDRLGSIGDARSFMGAFAEAYNHAHHHTGIGLNTPADVHYGHTGVVSARRSAALAVARAAHPERFTTDHDPKILALPSDAWINRLAEPSAA